jgi:Putative MetA-pathway of phenol degradation
MRVIPSLFLAAALPFSLWAQGGTPLATKDATSPAPAVRASDNSNAEKRSPAISVDDAASSPDADTGAQQSKSASPQRPKPSKPKPPPDSDRPPGEASMVGYIDDAIINSQIRVRFDAGFDDNRPDRAEFFYAACGCLLGGAKGPAPGLVSHLNFQQLYMRGEYAPVRRFSVFVEVPVRWVQPQQFAIGTTPGFGNQAGLSDVSAGFKFAALATRQHYLTFQLGATFPSGDSSKGLGTDHYSIQPSLLYFQKLTDRWSFEGQLGGTHAFEGDVPGFQGDVLTYGIGPSFALYKGERLSLTPVVEFVGWRVFGGLVADADLKSQGLPPVISADGTNVFNIKAGLRTSIGSHNSFYVGFGQAVTHEMWYKHLVRLEYRYTF